MGLPAKLTPEEQLLLDKFALKKKKKVAPVICKPTSNENQPLQNIKEVKVKKEVTVDKTPVVTVAPKDAKELAKKLLASGQLKINKSGAEHRTFKRAKPIDKKARPSLTESGFDSKPKPVPPSPKKPIDPPQFNSNPRFDDNNGGGGFHQRGEHNSNNLYVNGYGLTKAILDNSFPPFGPIKKIYFEKEKGYGYVTYVNNESAEKAINELHGSMVENVTLRVMYARKRARDDNRFTWRSKAHNLDEPTATDKPEQNNPVEQRLPRLVDRQPPKPKAEVKRKPREPVSYNDEFDF